MKVKLLPLKGLESLSAFRGYAALLLGLKHLPAYMGESYEDFYDRADAMPEADQEKILREAAFFVELQKEELEAMLGFCLDANGVPYSLVNMKNLGPDQIIDCVVSVALVCAKLKTPLVTSAQKKNLSDSASISTELM